MCSICRKFKKGSITVSEAREELDEQAEYLSEDHMEEIEEMLCEAEDTYDYIQERKNAYIDEEMDYADDNEIIGESDLPDFNEEYDLGEEDK